MQARRSSVDHSRLSSGSLNGGFGRNEREGLVRAYDEESGAFGLDDLAEDSDEETARRGLTNGHVGKPAKVSFGEERLR